MIVWLDDKWKYNHRPRMLLVSQVYLSEFIEIINSLLALKMFAYVFMLHMLLRLKKHFRWWMNCSILWPAGGCRHPVCNNSGFTLMLCSNTSLNLEHQCHLSSLDKNFMGFFLCFLEYHRKYVSLWCFKLTCSRQKLNINVKSKPWHQF